MNLSPKVCIFSAPGSGVGFEVSRTKRTTSQFLDQLSNLVSDDEELKTQILGSVNCSSKMLEILSGKQHTSIPQLFSTPEALELFRWELLIVALKSMDASGTPMIWQGIRHSRTTAGEPSFPTNETTESFFKNLTTKNFEELLRMVICQCRKPRLATELLLSYKRINGCVSLPLEQNLGVLAIAIGDTVFNSDTNRSKSWQQNHDDWTFRFVMTVPLPTEAHPCCKDYTCDLAAWKDLVALLLNIAHGRTPERLLVQYRIGSLQTVSTLELAMNFSVHDTFLLDTLLKTKLFSIETIEEAFSNLVRKRGIVLGPNLPHVLAAVYKTALYIWRTDARSQPTVQCGDTLSLLWSRLVSYSSGYDELEVNHESTILIPDGGQTRSDVDPSDWMAAVEAMVLVHAPNPDDPTSSKWDHTSPLFSSILVMALKSAVGSETKTHLVVYLLQQWLEHNRDNSLTTLFHNDPGSASDIIRHVAKLHLDAFPMLVEILLTKTTNETLSYHLHAFRYTLGLVIDASLREATRMIVRALTPHGVCSSSSRSYRLSLWVEKLGKAVSTSERNTFGSTVSSLINKEIEMDFVELLQSSEWSQEDKTNALVKAVECKHSIPAQVLSRPPHNLQLPAKHDPSPWLEAITQFLFQPSGPTFAGIVAGLEENAATIDSLKRDAPLPDDDEPSAQRQRLE
jgi:hypothetical protein